MNDPSRRNRSAGRPPRSVQTDPDLYTRIGRRILTAREAKHLTQDDLGAMLGESGATISRWEAAARKPTVEDLQNLAKVLDQDILHFIEESPPADSTLKVLNRLASEGGLNADDLADLTALAVAKAERKKINYVRDALDQNA